MLGYDIFIVQCDKKTKRPPPEVAELGVQPGDELHRPPLSRAESIRRNRNAVEYGNVNTPFAKPTFE